MKYSKILLFFYLLQLLGACARNGVMTTEQIQEHIEQSLKTGDPHTKIEEFLDRENWPFAYDRFAKRYSASYPDGTVENAITIKGVSIKIYVDESKEYLRAEVDNIYTGI